MAKSKLRDLVALYEEAKMLEKQHRAKSKRQYHATSVIRLRVAKRRLKAAVAKL